MSKTISSPPPANPRRRGYVPLDPSDPRSPDHPSHAEAWRNLRRVFARALAAQILKAMESGEYETEEKTGGALRPVLDRKAKREVGRRPTRSLLRGRR